MDVEKTINVRWHVSPSTQSLVRGCQVEEFPHPVTGGCHFGRFRDIEHTIWFSPVDDADIWFPAVDTPPKPSDEDITAAHIVMGVKP
jgi:hypothetical protein